jgi:hypothetical protein
MNRGVSLLAALGVGLVVCVSCARPASEPNLKELQRVRSGMLDIVVLSAHDAVRQGKDEFVLEFQASSDHHNVDVGTVKVSATMSMAGMAPMFGESTVMPTDSKGRYDVASDLSMAGTWRLGVEWDGPEGKGSATISAAAQ